MSEPRHTARSSESLVAARAPDPTMAAHAARPRAPDFFIIGHEKCGTTALYNILRQHPQIFMPRLKEPRFFIVDPDSRGPTPARATRPQTLEDYLALFAQADPEQRLGEASPQYIRSAEAARLIAEVRPDARIIAILKEPVRFVCTYHLSCVRARLETERDLRKAIALEEQRLHGRKLPRNCRAPSRLLYCRHARYVEQLRRFEAAFGRERMLVLIYDDFVRDNDATARQVFRFLDVDDTQPLRIAHGDQTESLRRGRRGRKAVRLQLLHRAALALQLARRQPEQAGRLARTADALTPDLLRGDKLESLARRLIFSVPASPDERFERELHRRFKPEVQALGEYLGRDLAGLWGYDRM